MSSFHVDPKFMVSTVYAKEWLSYSVFNQQPLKSNLPFLLSQKFGFPWILRKEKRSYHANYYRDEAFEEEYVSPSV